MRAASAISVRALERDRRGHARACLVSTLAGWPSWSTSSCSVLAGCSVVGQQVAVRCGQRDRDGCEAAVVDPSFGVARVVDPLDVDRVATSGEITEGRVAVDQAVRRADRSVADDLGELADELERRSTLGAGIAGATRGVSGMAGPDPAGDALEVGHGDALSSGCHPTIP